MPDDKIAVAGELEAALRASTWPGSLAHVHAAIDRLSHASPPLDTAREDEREACADVSYLETQLRTNARHDFGDDCQEHIEWKAADALASRDAEIAALKKVIGEAEPALNWLAGQDRSDERKEPTTHDLIMALKPDLQAERVGDRDHAISCARAFLTHPDSMETSDEQG